MEIVLHDCDLCGLPIKGQIFLFYIGEGNTEVSFNTENDYIDYVSKVKKETKDICPTCKSYLDKLFELRFKGLATIATKLLWMYEQPTKDPHCSCETKKIEVKKETKSKTKRKKK
jgi:hypothetical protein